MNGFSFNLDPVLLDLSFVEIRYYGVVFALTMLTAYLFWCWQMRRAGAPREQTEAMLIYGILGTLIGARLGHCLFYEWDIYSQHPLSILYFWQGGLSSHGTLVGILVSLGIFCWRYKLPYLLVTDRFTFSAAIGAAGIRFGNFLNSEIVGRATDLPWGVRFLRYDGGTTLRHPSQLYEFAIGILMLLILLAVDRIAGKGKRPLGLLTGIFLTLYFSLRFCIEFVKEYQPPQIPNVPGQGLTQGQLLSILPVLLGVGLILWSLLRKKSATTAAEVAASEEHSDNTADRS
jgi:phosphatidylglycerol---prolipoprotein diacylglyceryl transferase